MNKILTLLWITYFALAPVAWLPGFSGSAIYMLKLAMVASAVLLTWVAVTARGDARLPRGLLGILGFVVIFLAATPGLVQADFGQSIRRMKDIVLGFTMLWTMYAFARDPDRVLRIFTWSAVIVAGLAVLPVTAKLGATPNWIAPREFDSLPITVIGLGGKRGGWSNGIALYTAPLLFLAFQKSKIRPSVAVVVAVLEACIISSQFSVSGRAGLLTSLIILTLVSFFVMRRAWFFVFAAVALVVALNVGEQTSEEIEAQLRLDRLEGTSDSFTTLDTLSTGRFGQWVEAIRVFAEKPITGHGFGTESSRVGHADIHNLWLRLAVEGGILLPLAFLAFIIQIMRLVGRQSLAGAGQLLNDRAANFQVQLRNKRKVILFLMILGGVNISIFEPNVLLGSFQKTAIWWAAAGVLLGMTQREPARGRSTPRPKHPLVGGPAPLSKQTPDSAGGPTGDR